jgi:hypothetical protein
MQQKPYSREERFLSAEKHLLSPLPEQAFELKHYRELKVAQNNHVYLAEDKHYYSVPYTHIGTKVKVIYTRSLVRVYSKGEQIAVHVRSYRPSGYSTDKEHLCSHHRHYLDRSPAYYIEKARGRSEALCQLIGLLFGQGRHPEQVYRACDGLLIGFTNLPIRDLHPLDNLSIFQKKYYSCHAGHTSSSCRTSRTCCSMGWSGRCCA